MGGGVVVAADLGSISFLGVKHFGVRKLFYKEQTPNTLVWNKPKKKEIRSRYRPVWRRSAEGSRKDLVLIVTARSDRSDSMIVLSRVYPLSTSPSIVLDQSRPVVPLHFPPWLHSALVRERTLCMCQCGLTLHVPVYP